MENPSEHPSKLDPNALIAEVKVTRYLLKWRPDSDKSRFLAWAGYNDSTGTLLIRDIRTQLLPLNAVFEESTEYGNKFQIRGILVGPNGRILRVVSVWMIENATGVTKFLTLYPDRES